MKLKCLEKRTFIYWDKRGHIIADYEAGLYDSTGSFNKKKEEEVKRILKRHNERDTLICKLNIKRANKLSYYIASSTILFLLLLFFVINYLKP